MSGFVSLNTVFPIAVLVTVSRGSLLYSIHSRNIRRVLTHSTVKGHWGTSSRELL